MIDHISIAARNLAEAAHTLRARTGLGFYDGGYTAGGSASKIFPLGEGAYLVVEGLIDPLALEDPKNTGARQLHDSVANGPVFRGFSLRADSMAQLRAISARQGWAAPGPATLGRLRNDGSRLPAAGVPSVDLAWPKGFPNWNVFPEGETHPSGQPVIAAYGLLRPEGVAWLEVGGLKSDMERWVGADGGALPLRFNGKPPGVYGFAVKSAGREIVINLDLLKAA